MKKGMLQYFSNEEFALMMELTGGKEYSLFLSGSGLDDRRLTEAFISLFQRGFLARVQDTFAPGKEGAFFRELRDASHIILARKTFPEQRAVLCYVHKTNVWVVESQFGSPSERIRIGTQCVHNMGKWMLDADLLPQPLLEEEDAKELKSILADELILEPDSDAVATLSKYTGTGVCMQEYALYSGGIGRLVRISDGETAETCIYTWERLNKMLGQCFGG